MLLTFWRASEMAEQIEGGTVAVTKANPLQPRPDNL
jgi:hypothetical protein